MKYETVPLESTEYNLAIRDVPDEDGNYWHHLRVKRNGCVDYSRAWNIPFNIKETAEESERHDDDRGYLHICDITETIDMLTEVRGIAREHFQDIKKWYEDD